MLAQSSLKKDGCHHPGDTGCLCALQAVSASLSGKQVTAVVYAPGDYLIQCLPGGWLQHAHGTTTDAACMF